MANQRVQIRCSRYAFPVQPPDGRGVPIGDDALMVGARQAANDIAAHPPQTDHPKLHGHSPVNSNDSVATAQTAVFMRAMQIAITSSSGSPHQRSENISTST